MPKHTPHPDRRIIAPENGKIVNGYLMTGIITSDFQIRTRWGWMGFENAWWNKDNWQELLYPNVCVDVDHNNWTASGHILAIASHTTIEKKRKQADWREPRPMDYVLATIYAPVGSYACRNITSQLKKSGRIGISIEHGGRKPNRTIGPFVTVTDRPWNKDAWIIWINNNEYIYPDHIKRLPNEIRELAHEQYCLVRGIHKI